MKRSIIFYIVILLLIYNCGSFDYKKKVISNPVITSKLKEFRYVGLEHVNKISLYKVQPVKVDSSKQIYANQRLFVKELSSHNALLNIILDDKSYNWIEQVIVPVNLIPKYNIDIACKNKSLITLILYEDSDGNISYLHNLDGIIKLKMNNEKYKELLEIINS